MYLQTTENTLQKGNEILNHDTFDILFSVEIQSTMDHYRVQIEQYQEQLKYEEKYRDDDDLISPSEFRIISKPLEKRSNFIKMNYLIYVNNSHKMNEFVFNYKMNSNNRNNILNN